MEADPRLYSRIQSQTGIDLNALRSKYQNIEKNPEALGHISQFRDGMFSSASPSVDQNPAGSQPSTVDSNQVLSKYSICSTCNGLGLVKKDYNHMILESNCDDCEGEGILLKKEEQQRRRGRSVGCQEEEKLKDHQEKNKSLNAYVQQDINGGEAEVHGNLEAPPPVPDAPAPDDNSVCSPSPPPPPMPIYPTPAENVVSRPSEIRMVEKEGSADLRSISSANDASVNDATAWIRKLIVI